MILLSPPYVLSLSPGMEEIVLERFIASRIHPESNRFLILALQRLYRYSPSFRVLLTAFYKEQPKITLLLKSTEEKTFGTLNVNVVSDGYLIEVCVQNKLARLGLDSPEPWLGSLIFTLQEISRNGRVISKNNQDYSFENSTKTNFWEFQNVLRKELREAHIRPAIVIAADGRSLFLRMILGKKDGGGSQVLPGELGPWG